jgi:hypothetical protein
MDKYRTRIVYKDIKDTVVITDFDQQTGEPYDIHTYLWSVVRKWAHHANSGTTQPAPLDYPIKQVPSVGDYIIISDDKNNRAWYRIDNLDTFSFTQSFEDVDLVEAFNITNP